MRQPRSINNRLTNRKAAQPTRFVSTRLRERIGVIYSALGDGDVLFSIAIDHGSSGWYFLLLFSFSIARFVFGCCIAIRWLPRGAFASARKNASPPSECHSHRRLFLVYFAIPSDYPTTDCVFWTFGTEAGDCLEKNNDARDQPMDDGVA